jgi:S-adenosylmethionine:tRNA ribosyltransferase-isomerase
VSALAFDLPARLEAREPPEARGLARDAVRLLVATRSDARIRHARFRDLVGFLAPGDLLVVNVSATLPAAIPAWRDDGAAVQVHFATAAPRAPSPDWWIAELRTPSGSAPFRRARGGERLTLAGGARLELVAAHAHSARLWLVRLDAGEPLHDYLARHGRPIRYGYATGDWPLDDYQTVFARERGSAEMPSAARPFTPELVTRLVTAGVLFAPLTLHAGVSSLERHETPYPEPFRVPAETARLVDAVHEWGGRVIAVGTTVVRALETVAAPDGSVEPAEGWTDVVVTPARGLRAVDGLITGWHDPDASHLHMLEAAAGRDLLERSYRTAVEHGYLWHEFGDSNLILP